MDPQELLQEINRAEAAMEEAKAWFYKAEEAFEKWKQENPGFALEDKWFLYHQKEVDKCYELYMELVKTYNNLVKKMPAPATVSQEQLLSALPHHMKQAMKEEKESKSPISKASTTFVSNLFNEKGILQRTYGNVIAQDELDNNPETLEDWKKRSEAQRKEIVGTSAGIDIYNNLKPKHTVRIIEAEAFTTMLKGHIMTVDIKSIKTMSETNSFQEQNPNLTLRIPKIEGFRDVLYTQDFYQYLEEIGIKPASKRFADAHKSGVSMLIGTSGSGKTAACVELCRHRYALYFDCFHDGDFKFITERMKDESESDLNVQELEEYCRGRYALIIQARYYLLNRLFDEKLDPTEKIPWKWYSYQRSSSFQREMIRILLKFNNVQSKFAHVPSDGTIKIGTVIIDEANHLMEILKDRISSSGNDDNSKRPLLSLIVRFNQAFRVHHIYAGTHLSMKDHSLIKTGAGGGKGVINIFTDFDFYGPDLIQKLLKKALMPNAYEKLVQEAELLASCCRMLQGRVRFIAVFLKSLSEKSGEPFLEQFETTLNRYIKVMTNEHEDKEDLTSLYSFWKRNAKRVAYPMNKSSISGVQVFDGLLELLLNHFYTDNNNCIPFNIDLVDSALTRLHQPDPLEFTYSMDEPIVLEAGFNFLKTLDKDYISALIIRKMFGDKTCTPQHFGKLFEILLAVRCVGGWWLNIPDNDELWTSFPENAKKLLKKLSAPAQIVNQSKSNQDGIDWALRNFTSDQNYFVLPDNNLGPDGLWKYLVFNCKSTQKAYVSSNQCKKNYSNTKVDNWGKSLSRKGELKAATSGMHLLYFQLEFPYPNPENSHKEIEVGDQETIIPVNLDSLIAKYIFPKEFIDHWKLYMNR